MTWVGIRHLEETVLCPFCKSSLSRSGQLIRCSLCHTAHHTECWKENGNVCSVFRCLGSLHQIASATSQERNGYPKALVPAHLCFNVTVHFFINSLNPLVDSLRVPDAIALILLETLFIASGIAALLRFRPLVQHNVNAASLGILSAVALSGNAAFVMMLLMYLAVAGLQSLYALISF